ncbi:MAG: serine hydrolase domain-containing protein [Stackebrandtia sp.]
MAIAACGSSSADTASADKPKSEEVRAKLDKLVDDGDIIGGEATFLDGSDSVQVTAGLGNNETGSKYPSDAHFRTASLTKAFTSSLVLQLVAEGDVDLDASIEEYLPGLLHGDGIDAGTITIRHLLRHQSGLPEVGDGEEPPDPSAVYTPEELIDLALDNPGQFEPGSKMRYTNTNYVVAGMLIESVTGESFTDRLTSRITEPLGLDDTYLPEPGDTSLAKPHPHGYVSGDGKTRDVTKQEPSALWTSGGMVSTGADLNRFFTALAKGDVVEAKQLKQMRDTVPMTDVPGVDYGLGLMRLPVSCDVTVWGQAGDIPGFQAMIASTADGDRAVSLAMNQSPNEKFGPQHLLKLLDTAVC